MSVEHVEHPDHWDGAERRKLNHCDSHLDMVKSVAVIETTIVNLDKRINGSLTAIEGHMDQGAQWRIAIVGVAVALLVQAAMVINYNAKMMRQIEINTSRLDQMESLHPRTNYDDTRTLQNVRKMDGSVSQKRYDR